jgi:dynein heavy chain 1
LYTPEESRQPLAEAFKKTLKNENSMLKLLNEMLHSLLAEKKTWEENKATLRSQLASTVGDTLVSSAFLTYAGFFG